MLKRYLLIILCITFSFSGKAQLPWPAQTWNNGENLTSVMSTSGVVEASGLYWNKVKNRLYLVQNDGRVRILSYNPTTQVFTALANKIIEGGPEGITVVNDNENVFYTIDENTYSIHKYTHTNNFGTVTFSKEWNLLQAPSPMQDTGNQGPEGICFVPDNALSNVNFVSQATNLPYVSQKGMGGLLFIAHQDGGYIWVFDVNPNVSNDFLYVGKYKTNREESCDLAFDASTGMLYILHNIDVNYLEVTDLRTTTFSGNQKRFVLKSEYILPTPTNNTNIEGFALTEKCPSTNVVQAWLCRDVSDSESTTVKNDVLRRFTPFESYGECEVLSVPDIQNPIGFTMYPNPVHDKIRVTLEDNVTVQKLSIVNALGQTLQVTTAIQIENELDVSNLSNGLYYLIIEKDSETISNLFIKY